MLACTEELKLGFCHAMCHTQNACTAEKRAVWVQEAFVLDNKQFVTPEHCYALLAFMHVNTSHS